MKKKEWPVKTEANESVMARVLTVFYKVDQEAWTILMVGEVERKILMTKTRKALVNNKIVVQRRTMSVVQSKAVIVQTVEFTAQHVLRKFQYIPQCRAVSGRIQLV